MKRARLLAALMVLLVATPVAAVGYGLLARFVLHGEVTGASLAHSVARESPWGGGQGSCERTGGDGQWRCTFADDSGTEREYRVRVRAGSSCWDARRLRTPRPTPAFGGCVRRWQGALL